MEQQTRNLTGQASDHHINRWLLLPLAIGLLVGAYGLSTHGDITRAAFNTVLWFMVLAGLGWLAVTVVKIIRG